MLRFCDSFDHYAFAEMPRKWNTIASGGGADTSTITTVGRNSTSGLRLSTSSSSVTGRISKSVAASGATCIVQMALRVVTAFASSLSAGSANAENDNAGTGSTTTSTLFSIRQGGTTQIWFALNTSGQIVVRRGVTTLGTSSALTQNVMHYLEFKVVINDSTGTVDIKKDGVSILSLSSQDTKSTSSATWDEITIGHVTMLAAGQIDIDDFLIMDGSGSYNNDLIGDRRISALYPSAVGNSNASTPSSGGADRYTMVDETSPNDDTDYNTFAATGDKDTYGTQNCPTSGAAVSAVAVNMRCRKADSGEAGAAAVARISGTDYDGTSMGVPSSYANVQSIWERSAVDNTTAWTTAVVDAAEFGFKKAS